MKKTLLILAVAAAAAVASGAVLLYSGAVNVAADAPHHPLTYRLLEFARERSIAVRASELKPPIDLRNPQRVRRGSGNYEAMCVGCHLSPEAADSEIRKGLYPVPPRLADKPEVARDPQFGQARQFWIIKHGIKASGMPAWSRGGMEDDAIWDLVAFLQKLPEMSAADYRALVASSEGHRHGGLDVHDGHSGHAATDPAPAPPADKKGHSHPPGFRHPH